jgi:O-antigen/teichoic acid export membrane protein
MLRKHPVVAPDEPQQGMMSEPPAVPGRPMPGRSILRGGGLSVIDQLLISGVNFLTMLLVGRTVSSAEFGIFALAYTGLWILQNVQRAMIVEPMNTLGATKEGYAYRSYVGATAVSQVILAVAMGLVLLALGEMLDSYRNLLWAFALAVVFFQLQEFVRRIFYTRTRVGAALLNDLISYGGRGAILLILYVVGALTSASAMLAIGAAAGVAVLVGSWQARSEFTLVRKVSLVWESARTNWRFGRWLLGATFVPDLADRANLFLLLGLVGSVAVGAYSAAITLVRITNVLIQSFDTLLTPIASRMLRNESPAAMERYLKRVTLLGFIPVMALFGGLWVWAEQILNFAYRGTYDEYANVLRVIAIFSLSLYLTTPLRVACKSLEVPRVLFIAALASAGFLLTGGVALVVTMGLMGAAWGLVISSVLGLGATFAVYRHVSRKPLNLPTDVISA